MHSDSNEVVMVGSTRRWLLTTGWWCAVLERVVRGRWSTIATPTEVEVMEEGR